MNPRTVKQPSRVMERLLRVLLLIIATTATAQEPPDYSLATHWTGGVRLSANPHSPVVIGDLVLALDDSGDIRRVDASDPYSPIVLESIALAEPVRRLFGPHAGYIYAGGPDNLFILDAATFDLAATLEHGDVVHIAFGPSFGALLVDGGDRLLIFDPSEPTALTVLGSLVLHGTYPGRMEHAAIHDDLVLLSRTDTMVGVAIIDAGDPAAPAAVGDFGWEYYPWKRRTVIHDIASIRAFVAGAVYTLEDEYYYDSGSLTEWDKGHVTRWDFGVPLQPEVAQRGNPATHMRTGMSPRYLVRGTELLNQLGPRVVSMDLGDADLDTSYILCSLGSEHACSGLASGDGLLALTSSDGALHLIRERQPGGPGPVLDAPGGARDADLTGNRFMVMQEWGDYPTYLSVAVFDGSDPHNPVPLWQRGELATGPQRCRVTDHCAVLFDAEYASQGYDLESIDLAGDAQPVNQGTARDFEFLRPDLAAAVDDDGLRILDTGDATSFLELARPWDQPLREVAVVSGAEEEIVTRGADGVLRFWDLRVPGSPVSLGALAADASALVDVRGGTRPLTAATRTDAPDWPGSELMLIDCAGDPTVTGTVRVPAVPRAGWLQGTVLHLACGDAGLVLVDVTDLEAPYIRGGLATDSIQAVRLVGDDLLVAGNEILVLAPDVATEVTPPDDDTPPIPSAAAYLLPPAPNPFNPNVTIACELPGAREVRIQIHDLSGRRVRTLVDGRLDAGRHAFVWDGRDAADRGLPSGTYVARLVTLERIEARKLQLVR